jgi:hypothetical protein
MFLGDDRDHAGTHSKDDCVKCRRLLDDLSAKESQAAAT